MTEDARGERKFVVRQLPVYEDYKCQLCDEKATTHGFYITEAGTRSDIYHYCEESNPHAMISDTWVEWELVVRRPRFRGWWTVRPVKMDDHIQTADGLIWTEVADG